MPELAWDAADHVAALVEDLEGELARPTVDVALCRELVTDLRRYADLLLEAPPGPTV